MIKVRLCPITKAKIIRRQFTDSTLNWQSIIYYIILYYKLLTATAFTRVPHAMLDMDTKVWCSNTQKYCLALFYLLSSAILLANKSEIYSKNKIKCKKCQTINTFKKSEHRNPTVYIVIVVSNISL